MAFIHSYVCVDCGMLASTKSFTRCLFVDVQEGTDCPVQPSVRGSGSQGEAGHVAGAAIEA